MNKVNKKNKFLFLFLLLFFNLSVFAQDSEDPKGFDFNLPVQMAQKLPEDCKDLVLNTWQSCNELLENSSDPSFLIGSLSHNIYDSYNKYLEINNLDRKDNYELIEFIEYLQSFLFSGQLDYALQSGFDKNFIDKLTEILEKIAKTKEIVLAKYSQDFGLSLLESFFTVLKDQDNNNYVKLKKEYITPELEQNVINLNLALEKLKSIKTEDKGIQEAVDFWQTVLKRFEFLKNGFDNNGDFIQEKSSTSPYFLQKSIPFLVKYSPYIVGTYVIGHNALNLALSDLGYKKFLKLNLANGLKLKYNWFGVNSDFLKKNKNLILPLVLDKALGFMILPILYARDFKNKFSSETKQNKLILAKSFLWDFGYLCQVIIHYNLFHHDQGYWPSDYKPFKKASWQFMKMGNDMLYKYIDYKIDQNISPENLEKIENYSLGLARPELIKFLLDSSLPLVTYKYFPKSIVNFKREDLLKPEPWDWYYVGPSRKKDIAKMSDKTYVRNRILGYASISFGGFLGKKVALANKSNILKLMKFLMLKTGLINQDFLENLPVYKPLLVNEFKYFFIEEKDDDALLVDIKKMFLGLLINLKVVSQLDCAKFEQAVLNKGENLDLEVELFVDKILDKMVDGFVKQIGFTIGAFGAWHMANYYACRN